MNNTRTILYVEDDAIVLTAYQNRLQQAGFNVVPARDGLEAIKHLSTLAPDLVLLDLLLPRFNGGEVLQFMRNQKSLALVPVIILATNSIVDVAHEQMLESASKRIIKSFCTPVILLAAIQEVLAGENSAKPQAALA